MSTKWLLPLQWPKARGMRRHSPVPSLRSAGLAQLPEAFNKHEIILREPRPHVSHGPAEGALRAQLPAQEQARGRAAGTTRAEDPSGNTSPTRDASPMVCTSLGNQKVLLWMGRKWEGPMSGKRPTHLPHLSPRLCLPLPSICLLTDRSGAVTQPP